jgi:hypothetical protein
MQNNRDTTTNSTGRTTGIQQQTVEVEQQRYNKKQVEQQRYNNKQYRQNNNDEERTGQTEQQRYNNKHNRYNNRDTTTNR